jgi:filamentous hemagglutinin
VAGAASATLSADFAQAGIKQAATGELQTTYGQQALESLGLSPSTAAITYGLIGVSPAVIESIAVSRAFSAASQYNSLARASYSDFATNGVPITPVTMQTPVAQALIAEIKAGSPTLPDAMAIEYAKGALASGTSLPTMSVAAPGSILVKVVPKGDSVGATSPFWMSPQQAMAIATMGPAEAGMALGLPASQAAKIFENGMDFYAIAANSGASARVFVSDIAPTIQGGVATRPTAQQVIVGNRKAWSPAVQISPYTLKALK